MNRTLHYGLPIFEASDKPSILVDFNQAMQDIDESMFLIATGGDSHVADAIAALEQGLASVTSQIATINQTLGTKLDTSFMHNLAAEFDRTMTYFKYDFVFADGNLYQCIEDYDPNSSSFDICFRPVWLCNSVAKAEADLEELSDDYDALEARVTTLENAPGYSLPAATASTLGGIKVGSGLTISPTGVLDAVPAGISPATASTLGGIMVGDGLNVTAQGLLSEKVPAYMTTITSPMVTADNVPVSDVTLKGHLRVTGKRPTIALDYVVEVISNNTSHSMGNGFTVNGRDFIPLEVRNIINSLGRYRISCIGYATLISGSNGSSRMYSATGGNVDEYSNSAIEFKSSYTTGSGTPFTDGYIKLNIHLECFNYDLNPV